MKIGILGTAPAFAKAPFGDESWQLWAVPGCYSEEKVARNHSIHRFYELHSPKIMAVGCEIRPGFTEFARNLGGNFVLREPNNAYPDARIYDKDKYLKIHGRPPFSCSVSWMIAEAIEALEGEDEKVIGFWGVDMAHTSEYVWQKPGARELIGYARAKGITIAVEEGSELMSVPCLYGFEEMPPAFTIIKARNEELLGIRDFHRQQHDAAAGLMNAMQGALREHEFFAQGFGGTDVQRRKALLEGQMIAAQKDYDDHLRKVNIIDGALEEHAWVEQNFFKVPVNS